MKLINTTSYCSDKLKEIIKWCMPQGVFLKDIRKIDIGNTKLGWHGRAWGSMRLHVGVPAYNKYIKPYKSGGFRGYLPVKTYSWEESLIELVAHEIRHIWQYKNTKWKSDSSGVLKRETKLYHGIKKIRKYNMGTKAKLLEVDASLYAIRKVREYRRSNIKFCLT
jgi:hypothetical protein